MGEEFAGIETLNPKIIKGCFLWGGGRFEGLEFDLGFTKLGGLRKKGIFPIIICIINTSYRDTRQRKQWTPYRANCDNNNLVV